MVRATIYTRALFFVGGAPAFGILRPLPEANIDKLILDTYRMQNPMAFVVPNENHAKKKIRYKYGLLTIFFVKERRHSETISDDKCYIYRSMRYRFPISVKKVVQTHRTFSSPQEP